MSIFFFIWLPGGQMLSKGLFYLMILFASLTALGCDDSGALLHNSISDPTESGTALAGVFVLDGLEVTIQRNGTESNVTPVPWDGESEMESGVVYFLTPEQAEIFAAQNLNRTAGRDEWKASH